MRALIVGGDSVIGTALGAALSAQGHGVLASTRRPARAGPARPLLDLEQSPDHWPDLACDVAFLCAAQTSTAACDADPAGSHRVNVDRLLALTRRLTAQGAFVVFPSTNLAFDGQQIRPAPSAPTHPVGEYGRQRVEMEQALLQQAGVVRLGKVLNPGIALFQRWVAQWRQGQTIAAFTDLVMAPVTLDDVVTLLIRMAEQRQPGIFHYTAADDVSYFAAARFLAAQLGFDADTVVRPDLAAANHVRPFAHAALDCSSTNATFHLPSPTAQTALSWLAGHLQAETP